jgi:hypothetical protein
MTAWPEAVRGGWCRRSLSPQIGRRDRKGELRSYSCRMSEFRVAGVPELRRTIGSPFVRRLRPRSQLPYAGIPVAPDAFSRYPVVIERISINCDNTHERGCVHCTMVCRYFGTGGRAGQSTSASQRWHPGALRTLAPGGRQTPVRRGRASRPIAPCYRPAMWCWARCLQYAGVADPLA